MSFDWQGFVIEIGAALIACFVCYKAGQINALFELLDECEPEQESYIVALWARHHASSLIDGYRRHLRSKIIRNGGNPPEPPAAGGSAC